MMIRVDGLRQRYQHAGPWVLDGVDLAVARGELFGLLGPNGAGKTTLIHCLLGLIRPQAGRIDINGARIPAERRRLAGTVGLAPQSLAFYPTLTVAENLTFFAAMALPAAGNRRQAIAEAAASTRLQEHLPRRADQLSGGLKRRLNLAIALLGKPPLLILDEPTVGVDAQSRSFILDTLRDLNAQGTTIVYTTHYLAEAQRLCRRLAIVDGGRILACDTLPALLAESGDLETLFLRLTGAGLRDN